MLICSIEDCDRPHYAKTYCKWHYQRSRKYGDPCDKGIRDRAKAEIRRCSVAGCDRIHHSNGLCVNHWQQWAKHQKKHNLPVTATSWVPKKVFHRKEPRPASITSEGYRMVLVPDGTPGARQRNYMLEHRYVMQQMLGRPLLPNENIHHINGVKTDNRPENLQLWAKSQPSGQRVTDLVEWAKLIIETYQVQT